MKPGIDIVVCCHNSAERLPNTLRHIAAQTGVSSSDWGVFLVDNNSSDGTADIAAELWRDLGSSARLTIVKEERVGLGYARIRGIRASEREFVCFVDDDNWIDPDWVQRALATLRRDACIGAVGGRSEGAFSEMPPKWFDDAAAGYAIGKQAEQSGDITESRGYLWGAGLCLRRAAVLGLLDKGFEFLNLGRSARRLASGDDQELCLALRLAGWRLWYDDDMHFKHYMPNNRLRWSYAKAIFAGHGRARPTLSCYRSAYPHCAQYRSTPERWQWMLVHTLKSIAGQIKNRPICLYGHNLEALQLRGALAHAGEIIAKRTQIDRVSRQIRSAAWNPTSAP